MDKSACKGLSHHGGAKARTRGLQSAVLAPAITTTRKPTTERRRTAHAVTPATKAATYTHTCSVLLTNAVNFMTTLTAEIAKKVVLSAGAFYTPFSTL